MNHPKPTAATSVSNPTRRTLLGAAGIGALASVLPGGLARAQGRRGEVTVGTLSDVLTFDGYQYADRNYVIQRLVYDHLIDYDYQLNPRPAGLSAWTMAPDRLSAVLTMQPNITLHGGSTWRSSDLVQALERAANPAEGLQLLGPMAVVKDFRASGPHAVELHFKEAISHSVLTDLLSTMPVTEAERNTLARVRSAPAGGGPFRMVSRTPNDEIVLEKFARYWRPNEPSIERVVIKIFDNVDVMVAALQSRAIQMINVLPPLDAERLRAQFSIFEGYEGALGDTLRFNPLRPPYDNRKLRQAIRRAIDRDRIARELYAGSAVPAYLPWVKPSVGFDPTAAARLKFDLGAAEALWKEAGSPRSGQIMLDPGIPLWLKEVQIIQADLKRIGFDLQIEAVDGATLSRRAIAGDFGVFLSNIGNIGKRSPSAVTTNSFMRVANNVVWKDQLPPAYVGAMRKVRTAPTRAAEQAACVELNAVIEEECWFVPINLKRTLTAMNRSITGVWRDIDDRLDLRLAREA
ncbi:MAG: ABC transporter substrate-binding protein [Burkholderiales bacterium]|nr:ABC transporter substrate-binding protein [Burkholderiales bacterium]